MSMTNMENVYNEVTHSNMSCGVNGMDPMYHWDTHFPERLSINTEYPSPVARRSRKGRSRNSARFKTQPITFDEIKEVDEEPLAEDPGKMKNKEGLKSHFTAFSRSMDGLMPSMHLKKAPEAFRPLSSDYNENQIHRKPVPCPVQTESRVSHEAVVSMDTKEEDADKAKEVAFSTVPMPNLSDSARNRRQKRFKNKKQRHSRSIEEETVETDKNGAEQAVETDKKGAEQAVR